MKIVTFSEVDNELKAVIARVNDDADYTIVRSPGAEDAVIMSLQYFDSLVATAYLLDSPANATHLAKSIAQHRAGQITERELVED